MYKYKVVYDSTGGGHHPMTIEIEASGVKVHKDRIVFLDEHGEDEAVFKREDIVVYYTI